MPTRRSYLQRTFPLFLADDITQVIKRIGHNNSMIFWRGKLMLTFEEGADLLQVLCNQAALFLDETDFRLILPGDNNLSTCA